jgi:hypothetical protein
LSELDALKVAFGEHTLDIDLIKLTVDGVPGEHFAVIAGLGVDAMIMDDQPGPQGCHRCRSILHRGREGARAYPDRHADHP